jgi:hypothetical protein
MLEFAQSINAEDLERHLMVLASDEFEGRETAERGGYMAAEYIANFYRQLDIQPQSKDGSYSQTYPLMRSNLLGRMLVDGQEIPYLDDYMFFDSQVKSFSTDEVQFVGYGIESENYNDYDGIDDPGEVVLMLGGEPVNSKGIRWVSGTEASSSWANIFDSEQRAEIAASKGVKVILYVMPGYRNKMRRFRSSIEGPRLNLVLNEDEETEKEVTVVFISEELAESIIGNGEFDKRIERIKKKGKPQSSRVQTQIEFTAKVEAEKTFATNELAFIPGTDLADEVIVITAHYDHIGASGEGDKLVVNNGADDDGSGTVTLLEITEAFQLAAQNGHAPRRSVLLMAVSGEEKGLFGSKYYSENPVYPLEQTVCNLNIDMVGRIDTAHADNPDYIYLIGADRLSQDLHDISEACNTNYVGLELDYKYNDPKDPNRYYYRSDHYNFAQKGVPVIFYFNGTHEDYHAPTDTPEKIQYELMAKRGQLIFITAWHLANRDERIRLNE